MSYDIMSNHVMLHDQFRDARAHILIFLMSTTHLLFYSYRKLFDLNVFIFKQQNFGRCFYILYQLKISSELSNKANVLPMSIMDKSFNWCHSSFPEIHVGSSQNIFSLSITSDCQILTSILTMLPTWFRTNISTHCQPETITETIIKPIANQR